MAPDLEIFDHSVPDTAMRAEQIHGRYELGFLASETAQAAFLLDAKALQKTNIVSAWSSPLLPNNLRIEILSSFWLRFKARTVSQDDLLFWKNWYQGFLDGSPLDWELQRRVALIDDAIWKSGTEAVARAIREIEDELAEHTPLEDVALRTQVHRLLTNPILSEAIALNGAETIERTIADYLREAPANCLPEDLKHLEALPQHFKAIAHVIGSQTAKDEKEKRLVDEISKLHARVAELEKELAIAKGKELKGVISVEAAKAFGKTIGSPYFYGGIAMGVSYFFGVSPSDMTFENLRHYMGEVFRANSDAAVPSPPILPPSTDV